MDNITVMEREGFGQIRVLLIPPIYERNYEAFYNVFSLEFKRRFTFYTIKPIARHENGTVNYERVLNQCKKIITEEKITIVFANKQLGSFVKAVLCQHGQQHQQLRGPSIESIFLCCHKYYTTSVVDSREEKLPFSIHDIRGDTYDLACKVMASVNMPSYVRCCLGSGHSTYCFHNRDQLIHVLEKCRQDTTHILGMQRFLLENYVDAKKYPLAVSQAVIMNSFLNRFTATSGSTWVNVNIEACVFQGEIIPWAVADAITLPHKAKETSHIFPGFQMPSSLPKDRVETLWEEFFKDIRTLVAHGFDDSFVHAEYMVFEDGYVHLVTINGFPHVKNTKLYLKTMEHGNNVEASLQTSLGIRPKRPKLNGTFAINYFLLVFESGKADNLLRFDVAARNPDVVLRYVRGQDIVIEPAKDYAIVGSVTVSGRTFDECLEKVKAIRTELLKMPELVPLAC